jgi:thiamine biosynthesis lipoprotein
MAAFSGSTMGTTYSVKCQLPVAVSQDVAQKAVQTALSRVEHLMSTYRPDSEVSRFNSANAGQVVAISEETLSVLELAQTTHDRTQGAFDITVRPLVRAYGFGAGAHPAPPDEQELSRLLTIVGMQHLNWNNQEHTLVKLREGVEIDLSGIAKGYAVDLSAKALEELKVRSYMVEVGGEVRVLGSKPEQKPWRIAIEEPRATGRSIWGVLEFAPLGSALATSGDYRIFREVGGRVLSHTIDPKSGRPTPRRTASVSVVRPSAAEADALATGLSVLDPEASILLADQHAWAVLILVHQPGGHFSMLKSRAFGRLSFERHNQ